MHDLIDPIRIIQLCSLVMPFSKRVQLGITVAVPLYASRFDDSLILPVSPVISNDHSVANVLYS